MKLTESLQGYKFDSLADGYSSLTIDAYLSAMGILAGYLGNPEVTAISEEDLKGFMHYLRTDYHPILRNKQQLKELSTASLHRYGKAIRSYFKWASQEFHISRPDEEWKLPRYTNSEIVPFTQEEIDKLLGAIDFSAVVYRQGATQYRIRRPTALRDRAIVLLFTDTGIREGELTRLVIKDVNLDAGEVYVRPHHVGKTRPRTLPIGLRTKKAIWKYVLSREDRRPDDYLFLSDDGEPPTRRMIYALVSHLAQRAGVQHAHPHKFRHTFAIQFLRNGGDIFTLKRILGHATMETTNRYLLIAQSDINGAHHKSSPVDRWNL